MTYREEEAHLRQLFTIGTGFRMNGHLYTVTSSGKPTPNGEHGEPKTDVYISASCPNENPLQIKISFKKQNADLLENKMTGERACQIYGPNWQQYIANSIMPLRDVFEHKCLIHKIAGPHTLAGAFTLGWRCDLQNKGTGRLVVEQTLLHDTIIEIYEGNNLSTGKKNARVSGVVVPGSGSASHILVGHYETTQAVIEHLQPIPEFADAHPRIFCACKALNYHLATGEYDGNRPLCVYISWRVENGRLIADRVYDTPLSRGGDECADQLIDCLERLNIRNIGDITAANVADSTIVHGL